MTGPELDDGPLRAVLAEVRPRAQLHGLGADRSGAPWQPVADLLYATGRDWDRRAHRIRVLARVVTPAFADRWAAARPRDRDAAVLRACVRIGRAEGPGQAQEQCLYAARHAPDDPTPWIALLARLREQGVPPAPLHAVWQQIRARDAENRCAHHEVVRLLSPRAPHGTGSVVDMIGFARNSAARAPYGSPLALLPLAARVEHVACGPPLGGGAYWHDPLVSAEIDAALERWFHSGVPAHAGAVEDLNLLAFVLLQGRRHTEAQHVFRRMGRWMTDHPWDLAPEPERTFRYWQRRSGG